MGEKKAARLVRRLMIGTVPCMICGLKTHATADRIGVGTKKAPLEKGSLKSDFAVRSKDGYNNQIFGFLKT